MGRLFGIVFIVAAIYLGVSIYNGDAAGWFGAAPATGPKPVAETTVPEPARRPTAQEVLQQYGAPSARSSAPANAASGDANVMPMRGSITGYVRDKVQGAMAQSERRASGQ